MYRVSIHAMQQYCIRTGQSFMTNSSVEECLKKDLEKAIPITQAESLALGFTINPDLKNTLLFWHNDTIKSDLCAVVRHNTVVTILLPTKSMCSSPQRGKIRVDHARANRAQKGRV